MKCKVRLTRTVELIVEGTSEDVIMDWLAQTTPEEAYLVSDGSAEESYDEEIICYVQEDSEVDYVIEEEEYEY